MTSMSTPTEPAPHTVALLLIGNELLSGKIRDANGAWALERLRALGSEVRRLEVVPDEPEAIADALLRCRRHARQVITSGGIGTTHDDVTVPAIAAALGRRVVHSPEIVTLLKARRGEALGPYRIRLAELPEGGEVLWGDARELTFPAIGVDGVLILPGVPSLFVEKFEALAERFRAPPIVLRSLFLSCPEGDIAALLDETAQRHPAVAIGSYPRLASEGGHRVKVTVESRDGAEVARCSALLEAALQPHLLRVE